MSARTLIILDGVGLRDAKDSNAFAAAQTPVFDALLKQYPNARIATSGMAVGLPEGQMGNSEVGHMNLGAGRVVYQSFTRINKAIVDGDFANNEALNTLLTGVLERKGAVHLLGLLSPGGVHSHVDQIIATCKILVEKGVKRFFVHAFLDGRDTPPRSALEAIESLERELASLGSGRIATVVGRYYAMDRDNRWQRVETAYKLVSCGEADYQSACASDALQAAYEREESDEFVKATVIGDPVRMEPADGVMFLNFRPDRARELSQALINTTFDHFARPVTIAKDRFLTLTQYSQDLGSLCAFPPESIDNSLGEYLGQLGKTQLRIAETEKYAHVTFFFNGGREQPFPGEERILIPSPTVASYDEKPEMSAHELTDRLVESIRGGAFDLIVCNYANGDMVGHTGDFDAAVRAVETLDECLQRVIEATLESGGECLITADHGNVEQMLDPDSGQPHTAHTLNPVPLIYVSDRAQDCQLRDGSLCDIAPTLLHLMKLAIPVEMEGQSLLLD
ncbi:2,3-bisphosphoglycerate-independent phosphoglycerate mutase [Pseudomonas sp. LJDD11]|uniref:2,3-bisphosphoglycerate-independent phosphoglycerate mutase n=1 Tax=Pseudomonas sp. LJDD11 TaxID=2931984 RepID=UPI00211C4A6B|nr:2,3-bisphosphoglycerate-independent phosphoglycerate mutase [Pseudomonas sp. LJDD11]MCQ9426806.1 2,3-bisphosphoglycerate-independent phosphoglycerate mutase [Pseudomonas sp. LJDD11]